MTETISTERDLLREVGFHRTPQHIVEQSITDLMDLTGKKAVVTGAGGPGLGQASANRLAGLGADVVLIDKNLEGAQKVAAEIADAWGTKAHALGGDATDWDDVHRFIAEANELLGGIDILVNNVGWGDVRPFKDQTKEQIDRTTALSFIDTVYCSRAVLDYMIPQGSGRIINVASEAARNISPGMVVYGAAKAGVIHFTRCLANEVGELGINVNGVAPGTMLHSDLREFLAHGDTEYGAAATEAITMRFPSMDFKRVSLPEEVANVVGFLATDAAAYVSGVTVNAGGGIAAMG